MSARRQLMNRVCTARRRLRDMAAAVASTADLATLEAERAEDARRDELAAHELEATARYLAAHSARELLAVADEAALGREAVTEAGQRVAVARGASDVARRALAARARDLEAMERRARELRAAEDEAADKAEQKLMDDLGAARATEGPR